MEKQTFEEKILKILEDGLFEKIKSNMGWQIENAIDRSGIYTEIANRVIENHKDKIEKTVNTGIEKAFASKDFVTEMEKTLNKKLSESIISNFDAKVQSIIDMLRAKNPVFNEEIKIAITKILKKYNVNN